MLDHIYGAKDNVIMDMPFVCMGRQHVFILTAQNIVGKLPPDLMASSGSFAPCSMTVSVDGDIVALSAWPV
jgi:hypothetical protein